MNQNEMSQTNGDGLNQYKMTSQTNPEGLNEMTEITNNLVSDNGESQGQVRKRAKKFIWDDDLHRKFLEAFHSLGPEKPRPKDILELMKEVPGINTRIIASHLQKYRNQKSAEAEARLNNPQDAYNSTSLYQEYLSKSHPIYGIGQPSNLVMNNDDSNNHMGYGPKPTYDVSQGGSNVLPVQGGSPRVMSGVIGTSEVSQVPRFGKSDASSNVFRMKSNLGTGYNKPSRFVGLMVDKHGNLIGLDAKDFFGENLGGMNCNFNNNNGQSPSVFGTPQASQVPLSGHHGTPTNDVSGMNPNHSTGYKHSNYTGINTNEHAHFAGFGGVRVNGNSNDSHGQIMGTMNCNLNNNNMMSNYGCSTSRFASPYQSKSNLNAQMNGLVPVPQNPSIPSYHHGINQIFNSTVNSQFNQNQHQDQVSTGNFGMANNIKLERNVITNVNDNTSGEMLNSVASNLGLYVPTPNMNYTNQVNANTNGAMLNSVTANSEVYVSTPNMNTTNQVQGAENSRGLQLPFNPDLSDGDFNYLTRR